MKNRKDNKKHFIIYWPIEGKGGEIKVGSVVSELLTNGRYKIVQIDTLNDINLKTQKLARRFLCTGYQLINIGDIVYHLPDSLPGLLFEVMAFPDPDFVNLRYLTHPNPDFKYLNTIREFNPREAMFKLEYEITLTPQSEWVCNHHWVELNIDTKGTKQKLNIKCPNCNHFHEGEE